ncbi:LytR C-terminal domain-containing protein [Micrococcoides hystricis]|uniref:LytR C-terminal domain-containing protein n=1 Tax=Micrococcoides hystricis TaxID=1572761 RepID=A0ABV6PCY7_9MICC
MNPSPRQIRKAERKARKNDVREWHGHRIVSEEDLTGYFEQVDPADAKRAKNRRRTRHTVVILILLALIAGIVFFAYKVIKGEAVIPGWEHREPTALPACPTDARTVLDPKDVTVHVYNGTNHSGLAGKTADQLKERGFSIGTVGNAKLASQSTHVLIVTGAEGFDAAFTAQKHFNNADVITDGRTDASVDVVLGYEFKAPRSAKKVNKAAGALNCLDAETDEEAEQSPSPEEN